MKLFLLFLTKGFPVGNDCNCAVVVRASNELEARQLTNEETKFGDEHFNPNVWLNSEFSQCQEITLDGEPEVILKSPNVSNGFED